MKRFGIASRETGHGSTASSPFDSDRPRSVAATHDLNNATGLSRISNAFVPRSTLRRSDTSPVQRQNSFATRLASFRRRYGPNGIRSDSPSISQPTDVRLVQGGSPVNYITSKGSSPQTAATSPNYFVPGRSSSLGFTRFDDLPPSPLASHPVTAEDFHSVTSRNADEKHFRCTIHVYDGNSYRDTELKLKGMVAEAGGKMLDTAHRWPGGFFYSMEGALGDNPLEDGTECPGGGRIGVIPFDLSEPVSFKGTRSGMMRAKVVEIPPRAESRV